MTTELDELATVIDAYENAWNAMNFDALAALWDKGDKELYYVAEEVDTPLYSFDDILSYWNRTRQAVEWVKVYLSGKRYKLLNADLATVTFEMHVDASMRGAEQQGFKPVGVDVRVSVILRKTSDGWRFIHYAEAAMGALPFIRRMYNNNVRGG